MWIAPDQNSMEGRWFWGAYEEFGYDVTLHRASDGVTVTGTDLTMIKTGSTAQKVKIYGDNFPKLTVADIDFGTGVTVKRIVDQTAQQATVEVDVDAKAIVGKRDVSVRRTVAPNAIAVYDKIDYIKVSPDTSLARLGGVKFPKGYQQFEAIAYNRGPDGKPNTADDVELGPRGRGMVARRILRGLRRRRQGIRRQDESHRIFHAGRGGSESEAQIQPQQLRRRVGGGDV